MIFLSGGAVYGWPSMRQILRRDGALREGCGGALEDDAVLDAVRLALVLDPVRDHQVVPVLVGQVLDDQGLGNEARARTHGPPDGPSHR